MFSVISSTCSARKFNHSFWSSAQITTFLSSFFSLIAVFHSMQAQGSPPLAINNGPWENFNLLFLNFFCFFCIESVHHTENAAVLINIKEMPLIFLFYIINWKLNTFFYFNPVNHTWASLHFMRVLWKGEENHQSLPI